MSLALRDIAFHLDLETARNSEFLERFESPACEPAVPGVEGENQVVMFPLQSCQKFAHFPRKASLEDGINFWEDIRTWKFSENRLLWSLRGSQFLSTCAADKALVSHSLSGRKHGRVSV